MHHIAVEMEMEGKQSNLVMPRQLQLCAAVSAERFSTLMLQYYLFSSIHVNLPIRIEASQL